MKVGRVCAMEPDRSEFVSVKRCYLYRSTHTVDKHARVTVDPGDQYGSHETWAGNGDRQSNL